MHGRLGAVRIHIWRRGDAYGSEACAVAKAANSNNCSSVSMSEALHLGYLRGQHSTPSAVVLTEVGELPVWLQLLWPGNENAYSTVSSEPALMH